MNNEHKKSTILVVDDLPENIDVLRGILSNQYAINIASSGAQALKVAKEQQPDLILLDIMMPEMDGYEVCRRLKADKLTAEIPVIFVTALDEADDEMKGLSLGAIDYVTKPIHASIALARIKNHLELRQRSNELQELNRNLEQRVSDEVARNMDAERLGLLGKLFDMGHEAVMITDAENRIVAVNKAFSTTSGYSREEVLGKTPKMFQSGRHNSDFYMQLWQQLIGHDFWQGELWNRRKDGVVYPEWLSISAIRDANGRVVNYLSTFSDISKHMQMQEKVRHMALHDHLTGLPNRAAFNEQLERAILRAMRHKTRLAVVMMDLDRFKEVNDSMGHAAGDQLLLGVAGRMQVCLRGDDFICRLGGDEFVVIMHDIHSAVDIETVCDKLLNSIAEPYLLNGHKASVTLSMGIAIYPEDGRTEAVLMENADAAMYQTKKDGRANYTFFKKPE